MSGKKIFDDQVAQYFSILKDYAKHEDSLINNRLSWAMGVSSAMILAIGAIVTDESITSKNASAEHIRFALISVIGLSIVGLITTVSCGFGIYAAMNALKRLSDCWDKFEKHNKEKFLGTEFPSILGGGHDGTDWLTRLVSFFVRKPYDLGLYYPHFILFAFLGIWISIIYTSINLYFFRL